MAIKDTAPCNTDLLQSSKFILSFPRIIATQFFCQVVNIPDITVINNPVQPTPFKDLNIPGDKLNYQDLTIVFQIDEELNSWTIVYDWLKGITFPHDFGEYKNLDNLSRFSDKIYPQYADAELKILSTVNKPLINISFKDCFPVFLSGFSMDIRDNAEKIITASATFRYKDFTITRV